MKFPVKKNPLLILFVISLIPIGIVGLFIEDSTEGWLGFIVITVIAVPLLWALFDTYHELTEEEFIVKFGPLKKTIRFENIKSIHYTYNPLSSPAWTFKRVAITQFHYKTLLVSVPEDEQKFKKLLLTKCPQADINLNDHRK